MVTAVAGADPGYCRQLTVGSRTRALLAFPGKTYAGDDAADAVKAGKYNRTGDAGPTVQPYAGRLG